MPKKIFLRKLKIRATRKLKTARLLLLVKCDSAHNLNFLLSIENSNAKSTVFKPVSFRVVALRYQRHLIKIINGMFG